MRQLASVKIINNILPIEGRDRIELAIIDGWSVIVKKDEFKINDKCVYIEIDSVLPEKPEFEFLRSKDFRIKTMKMAGVISQGICFPMNILPVGNYEVNQDVTEILGIKKYEPTTDDYIPTHKNNNRKYNPLMRFKLYRLFVNGKRKRDAFPSIIPKTDETRIQNMPFILNDKSNNWVVTEKVDGQSGSFILVRHRGLFKDKFEYIICSRNRRLNKKDDSSYWQVSDKYHIEDCLKDLIGGDAWVAIQGECISPKVQGNKYKVDEADLFVFNLIRPSGRRDSITAKYMCEKRGLKFVPIVEMNYTLPTTVDEMLKYAHGDSVIGDTIREGVVVRNVATGVSFKAVDPEFLIKYNE